VNNVSGWDHSGPVCKIKEQNWMTTYADLNYISPFSNYILQSIPPGSPNIARHDLPIQCSISGSTNMVLSTLLWGTGNIALSLQDLCKIVLGIIALLCLDGGHTFQEVLTAVCLISNFYRYFKTYHVGRDLITCFNNTTITNLYEAMKNLEFLPRNIINNEIIRDHRRYIDQGIIDQGIIDVVLARGFSTYEFTSRRYPHEYYYKIFVCYVMDTCRQETNAAIHNNHYYNFWTDTFEYINLSLLFMLNSTPEYSVKRQKSRDDDGSTNFVYKPECRHVCGNVAIGGGGIASSKNKKNKKAASPRTLPLATLERSSRTQLSFGSPRARKYRLRGSPPSTASRPVSTKSNAKNAKRLSPKERKKHQKKKLF
jgi:hypothetical protein